MRPHPSIAATFHSVLLTDSCHVPSEGADEHQSTGSAGDMPIRLIVAMTAASNQVTRGWFRKGVPLYSTGMRKIAIATSHR